MSSMINLRSVTSLEASCRQKIGAGKRLDFCIDDIEFELKLTLTSSNTPSSVFHRIECDTGAFWLTNHWSFIQNICQFPVTASDFESGSGLDTSHEAHELRDALSAYYIVPELAALFSNLSVNFSEKKTHPYLNATTIQLAWQISNVKQVAKGLLQIAPETLDLFLSAVGWQNVSCDCARDWVYYRVPLVLGQVKLSGQQCSSLEPGDIVIPEQQNFLPIGQGVLNIGDLRLELEWCGDVHQCRYRINAVQRQT